MYYVYVLQSLKDYKFYIGYSTDLKRRIKEHQAGQSFSTSFRLPVQLIFYEAFFNKHDATRREMYFKTTKGKRALKIMLRNFLSE